MNYLKTIVAICLISLPLGVATSAGATPILTMSVCHVTPSGHVQFLTLPIPAAVAHLLHHNGDWIPTEQGCFGPTTTTTTTSTTTTSTTSSTSTTSTSVPDTTTTVAPTTTVPTDSPQTSTTIPTQTSSVIMERPKDVAPTQKVDVPEEVELNFTG